MDKLLELKLENEILKQKLERLRGNPDTEPSSPRADDDELYEETMYDQDIRNSLDLRGGGVGQRSGSSTLSSSCTSARHEKSSLPTQNIITPMIKKKRKHKLEDDVDRVCTECGKTDSPEWRKGPQGPKTLCNACGLRWAKKSRRELKGEEA